LRFGVFREVGAGERRVALTPSGVGALITAGHEVFVEARAGEGAGFNDTAFLAVGAEVVYSARDVAMRAECLLRVNTPSRGEVEALTEGSAVVGFLHLSSCDHAVFEALVERSVTTIALELIRDPDGSYPVLGPLSAIGGQVTMSQVAWHLTTPGGGDGTLLGGCPGVLPAHVVILGAGVAGAAVAEQAARMGARVTLLDIDERPLRAFAYRPGVATAIASPYNISRCVENADVLVGAVARRGEPAPKVLSRHQIRTMRPGSLFVDLSIDEGGCAETSRPTSPEEPIYEEEGVRHLCTPNLTSVVAATSSRALTNVTLPYLKTLGELGLKQTLRTSAALAGACQLYRGQVVSRLLARHRGGERQALPQLLGAAGS